jgi:hypothetical protein
LSSTSYGANNAFGQAGFTIFDGNVSFPVMHGFEMSVGATNLFNHDNYQAGGIYDGGYTFQTLGGGTSYTTYFFTQPRTVYLQLSRHFGAGKTANVKRTNPNQ